MGGKDKDIRFKDIDDYLKSSLLSKCGLLTTSGNTISLLDSGYLSA
jgi:hypothetical protein